MNTSFETKPQEEFLSSAQGESNTYPGWQCLVSFANRSGKCTVWDGAVYEGDHFTIELGSTPEIKHIPGDQFGDEDKIIATYACAKVPGSYKPIIEYCTVSQIINHRDRYNEVGADHYSYQYFEAYARKLPLLRILKRVLDRSDWEVVEREEYGRLDACAGETTIDEAIELPGLPESLASPSEIRELLKRAETHNVQYDELKSYAWFKGVMLCDDTELNADVARYLNENFETAKDWIINKRATGRFNHASV